MRSLAALAALAAALVLPRAAEARRRGPPRGDAGEVTLDGARTPVVWTDGDSFRPLAGPLRGLGLRVQDYDALETYGPVHRWGAWDPRELLAIARQAAPVAAAARRTCSTVGSSDRYRRPLVRCPDAALELVRRGLALVYVLRGAPPAELLAAQREAQAARRGMWAKGVPRGVVASVHSAAENDGVGAYNRVADTRTGLALPRPHHAAYAECEEVCEVTEGDRSCMRYVPFRRRHGRDRAACLR